MEEEIITPEEDTFGYNKLRYILNNDGYVCHASLGGLISCDLGECTEYTGEIPNGYETIEEWYDTEIERLNSWKIVEGNLVFDESKYAELKIKCKQEEKDNSFVCHKELFGLQQQIEDIEDVSNSQYVKENATGKVVLINNVKKSFPRIRLTNVDPYLFNKVDLLVTGKNMLFNNATTQTIAGIEFKQNEDRSITINGTSTEDIEYTIGGTSNNTSPFLCMKKGLDYYLSSNNYQIKMYNYDGTDRTEVYSGKGGIINFTDEDKPVTQIVLCISKGKTIEYETVYPQLEYGDVASEYETYKSNKCQIDFSEYVEEKVLFPSDLNIKHSALKTGTTKSGVSKALNEVLETTEALYPSDDLYPFGTSINYIVIENGGVTAIINNEEVYLGTSNVCLFDGIDLIHTIQDTDIEIEYCINLIEVDSLEFLQGKATTTNKFKILEDGSIEAHNGYFSGIINGGSINISDVSTIDDPYVRISKKDTEDLVTTSIWNNGVSVCDYSIPESNALIRTECSDGFAELHNSEVNAFSFNNVSLEKVKKNIKKTEKGLDLIKKADVCSYNYRGEKNGDKKHIGLVIGEKYNTPEEIMNSKKTGIDLYSMIAVAWQSIKELNNKIEELETKIKEMEEKQYEKNSI